VHYFFSHHSSYQHHDVHVYYWCYRKKY